MKKFSINPDFIAQELKNSIVIFDSEKSILFTFNETASFIFKKLKRKSSPEEIITALIKNFDVPKEQAHKDVYDFINLLQKNNILKV